MRKPLHLVGASAPRRASGLRTGRRRGSTLSRQHRVEHDVSGPPVERRRRGTVMLNLLRRLLLAARPAIARRSAFWAGPSIPEPQQPNPEADAAHQAVVLVEGMGEQIPRLGSALLSADVPLARSAARRRLPGPLCRAVAAHEECTRAPKAKEGTSSSIKAVVRASISSVDAPPTMNEYPKLGSD